MNKKVIGIIAVIVIIVIAIIGGMYLLKDVDSKPQIDTSKMADELDPYIDNMDSNEIKDVLDSEMTDEQKNVFEDALNEISVPDNIIVTDDGKLAEVDENGNETIIDHPHQDVLDMTDEEAEEDFDRVMEELNKLINSNEDRNTRPNTGNTTDISNNINDNDTDSNSDGSEPNKDGWNQAFYETLTPEQQETYKNLPDASYRNMMQQSIEKAQALKEQGWTVEWGTPTEEQLEEAWSHITVGQ